MPAGSASRLALKLAAAIAVLFGAATVASGGNVLFGDGAQGAGHYVPFIVWFNFLAGFACIVAGVALWKRKACTSVVAGRMKRAPFSPWRCAWGSGRRSPRSPSALT
jgi:hypothetical protein